MLPEGDHSGRMVRVDKTYFEPDLAGEVGRVEPDSGDGVRSVRVRFEDGIVFWVRRKALTLIAEREEQTDGTPA